MSGELIWTKPALWAEAGLLKKSSRHAKTRLGLISQGKFVKCRLLGFAILNILYANFGSFDRRKISGEESMVLYIEPSEKSCFTLPNKRIFQP